MNDPSSSTNCFDYSFFTAPRKFDGNEPFRQVKIILPLFVDHPNPLSRIVRKRFDDTVGFADFKRGFVAFVHHAYRRIRIPCGIPILPTF